VPASPSELTFERVYASPSLNGSVPRLPKLSPDGRFLALLRNRAEDSQRYDLWAFDRESGQWSMLVDSEKLGAGLTVLAEITLDRQGAEHLAAFEARAVAEPAVQQCYRVSPGPDFMLVMQAPDMAGYHALVQRLFTQDANVRNVKAFFNVHRAKFEPRIALPVIA
jgi:hypothetical protein